MILSRRCDSDQLFYYTAEMASQSLLRAIKSREMLCPGRSSAHFQGFSLSKSRHSPSTARWAIIVRPYEAERLNLFSSAGHMLGPTEFRELVSGRRRGARAAALRGVLRAAEVPYTVAVGWRNRRYDRGHAAVHHLGVPVISVGNLTLGGTGKTPMVKWLAQWLKDRSLRAAIVSRGYGANGAEYNDEALELHQALPDVPHIQNPQRIAAAELAISQFNSQVIVLDDGFQHRRLARDLDVVLLDALEPFGFGHVFPRGTLREPVSGLQRAHVVCLSRADALAAEERKTIFHGVSELAPRAAWCECAHAAYTLVNSRGQRSPLSVLEGKRVAAFCGIGNPAGFHHTLASSNCQIAAWHDFPDHYAYGPNDLAKLHSLAASCGADMVVCTQKDLVKLTRDSIAGCPLWAVAIELRFLTGQESFEAALEGVVRRHRDASER
jgi:tetraacyldisaccharide 4'-kinase